MKKETIIYYPYPGDTNKFHANMIDVLNRKYNVIGIEQAMVNPFLLLRTKKIYFNNIENRTWSIKWKFVFGIIKLIHMEVNYFFHNYRQYEFKNADEAYNKVKYMVDWADNVYILSSGGRKILEDVYDVRDEGKIKDIDHINYINSYPESRKNYRQDFNIPANTLLIGFFGKIRPYKNIELLINSFNSLQIGEEVHLLIAGEPINTKYGQEIVELCKNNSRIHLSLERIPDENLSSLFKALDIVVLPYNVKENMNSGVMVATFSYKRSVLTANTEMAKDFNKQGFIYMYDATINEKDNFRLALENVIIDGRELLHAKGEKAYEYVLLNNSPEHVLKQLED